MKAIKFNGGNAPGRGWDAEEREILRNIYPDNKAEDVAEWLGRNTPSVRYMARQLGIKKSEAFLKSESSGRRIRGKNRYWTSERVAYLKIAFPDHLAREVASKLGCAVSTVYQKAHALGIRKSPEFFASDKSGRLKGGIGKSHRFTKGNTPWNAGLKGEKYKQHIGSRSVRRMGKTWFKKGQQPQNTYNKESGVISIRIDHGSKKPYKYIKLAHGKWRELHRHLWEETHGPIPEGHVVIFQDGNTMNCTLGNLELITMAENLQRNHILNLPEDLREVIRMTGVLKRKLKKLNKTTV